MKKKTIWTWAIVAVCIVALIAVPLFHHFKKINDLKEEGIYEIITLSPQTIDETTEQHSYYMVCEPSSDREEVEAQIESFIDENNIVASLEAELAETWVGSTADVEFHLWFVRPSSTYPIGKFPWNESDFDERECTIIGKYIFQNGTCIFEYYLAHSI